MKKLLTLYGLSLAYIIYTVFAPSIEPKQSFHSAKSVEKFDINFSKHAGDMNRSFYSYWGISAPTPPKEAEENLTKPTHAIKQEKKSLCIDEKCYRFLAIKDNQEVIVYAEHFKKKIQRFKENEKIESNLTLKEVRKSRVEVEFLGENYTFKFFDVNLTQYKPKEKQYD